ncbi:type I DNA topoisomerase [Mycoplasma anserisalpingitidis]|uniref:DNA topoisomerase 1 n=2 Tax=Mycoplasma anserisalpingitidis TaxID=519450 RepID=A0A5B8K5Y1_9MOLU|nr:type I DNA topoisomerase [Mycoplasma anserisalpingitidis]QDY88425.1 type I DNA topoisomerase [Mycoplasma anserisalpingitidis]
MKTLVIVESPNKVNTIKKILGEDYVVEASIGHIAKLKTSGQYGLGIDIENWEPSYTLEKGKKELIKKLKSIAKKCDKVFIATDPDREGEAIGEHLVEYLDVKEKYNRIKYNEITKNAILKAIDKPGLIDYNLVEAQKARRMLDRIIGFRLSYLINQKISNSPTKASAGRVQSIALKLVVDREREIEAFVPEQYYKLDALCGSKIVASYINLNNSSDKRDWILPNEIDSVKKHFENAKKIIKVTDINVVDKKMSSVIPLKQAALYKKSPYSAQVTQSAAQKLYEGFGDGGLISYPRTDSSRLSQTFIDSAKVYINDKFGKEYVALEVKGFSGDQDAHEAIRPTDVSLTPENALALYPEMSKQEFAIYKLIYRVTMQSLMTQPIRTIKTYTYENDVYKFRNSFSSIKFDGYYILDDEKEVELGDPNYELNQEVKVKEFKFSDHETKPSPRYTDGSLIEMLDKIKVGRPSTFATTVKIIKDREYVVSKSSSLVPTLFGKNVIDKLTSSFSNIINEEYTAKVEEELDLIAEEKVSKNIVMNNFWEKFNDTFDKAKDVMEKTVLTQLALEESCPEDSGVLVIRRNKKKQKFVGCKNFPNCKYTRSISNEELKKLEENINEE